MVRLIGILVGLFFSGWLLVTLVVGFIAWASEPAVKTAEHEFHQHPKELSLASDGPFGHFDTQQLQRGYKVYKEVCSACHSLRHVAFRDLEQLGYSEAQVKAEAATWQVPGIDAVTGEANTRPGMPTDYFPKPFANDVAARAANNNAIPPDLSLMAKARHDGAAYVYSLLSGYQDQPAELLKEFPDAKTPDGLHYNPYFANLNLAMAPPLADGQVTFDDGAPNDLDAMSQDLAAFLVWTAEPTLAKRHQTGWPVVLFLIILSVLAYLAYRNVWRNEKH
ncbi:cytochrome c1 [Croceicoccus ponticola]|uniref:Cytochrome c1 n=1 Tax=Croceicoccus ponticola TaxID=2217664 RepID=A0A437GZ17_9SPHN|nr:cytochrome c1 [Croceicoccus ponticola]RVQ67116.1 cytochrome c1 [Croceicoccus ponticola]